MMRRQGTVIRLTFDGVFPTKLHHATVDLINSLAGGNQVHRMIQELLNPETLYYANMHPVVRRWSRE